MRYIPSPIPIHANLIYRAEANKSGRMQYHKIQPGRSKQRISRAEFIKAFNNLQIVALNPLPVRNNEVDFQIEFYT
ncbi:MAG: hypothetical protein KF687_10860 [Cyclobacteriaceae bacterium]|nr:hypothetical protein [Cyclobacteriaceae bacterium]